MTVSVRDVGLQPVRRAASLLYVTRSFPFATAVSAVLLGSLLAPRPASSQVSDSAGVRVIVGPETDRPLHWLFREQARVGASEHEPNTFFGLYPWNVATDTLGHIFVLDVGDSRVVVLDSTGNYVRQLGSQGGGPGEFIRPIGLAVWPDGSVAVSDAGKRALVRFDADGRILDQHPLPGGYPVGPIAAAGSGIIMALALTPTDPFGVAWVTPDTVAELAILPDTTTVTFSQCGVGLTGLRPVFAPKVLWAANSQHAVVTRGTEYRVDIYRGSTLLRSVRRPLAPIRVSRSDALRAPDVANGMTIRHAGGVCRVSPQDVLDARGFARQRSPLAGVALAPDGRLWIRRARTSSDKSVVDVFDPTGAYVGTLPPSAPQPSAFLSSGRIVTIESTVFGAPVLVIYDIEEH